MPKLNRLILDKGEGARHSLKEMESTGKAN